GAITAAEVYGREDQIAGRIFFSRGIGNLCRLTSVSGSERVLAIDLPIRYVKRRVRQELHMSQRWSNLRFSDRYVICYRGSPIVKSGRHLRACAATHEAEF